MANSQKKWFGTKYPQNIPNHNGVEVFFFPIESCLDYLSANIMLDKEYSGRNIQCA